MINLEYSMHVTDSKGFPFPGIRCAYMMFDVLPISQEEGPAYEISLSNLEFTQP